jgi:hypothetical protein
MPSEKAMTLYVEELQKIVETMSYTENVADFYGSIGELDNVSIEDLALVAPAAIKKERSNPHSPLHSRETSPARSNGYTNSYQNGYSHSATDTSDDDEYIDTVEVRSDEASRGSSKHHLSLQDEIPVVSIEHMSRQRDRKLNYSQQNGGVHKKVRRLSLIQSTLEINSISSCQNLPMTEVTNKLNIDQSTLTQLVQITDKMRVDLQQVNGRMNALEQKVSAGGKAICL